MLAWAAASGIPVWGELELGARLCDVPYLAVTGTNGKTTTTGMIASCLRAAGHDAVACGNIGHPFPLAAREGHDVLVVEASSFQLRFVETFHPRVSVLLNLAPDHLDWHGSEQAYVDAKRRIVQVQGPGDTHVGNRDDARAAAVSAARSLPGRLVQRRERPRTVRSGTSTESWSLASRGPSRSDRSMENVPGSARTPPRPPRRAWRSGRRPSRSAGGSRASRRRTTEARSSPWSTACVSWTTRRRRTCTPRSPRSTAWKGRC